MAHWAKRGVRCICIDDTPRNPKWEGTACPKRGRIYTVRHAGITPHGKAYLTLEEIVNPTARFETFGVQEWAFSADRFRPFVPMTEAQDLALFTHHLTTTEQKEPV